MDGVFKQVSFDRESLLSNEWLVTNENGSYAASSIANAHTRKYHALFAARLTNNADALIILNNLEDTIITPNQEFSLGARIYRDAEFLTATKNLTEFVYTTYPRWRFTLPVGEITRELLLAPEKNTLLVKYSLDGDTPVKLRVRSLFGVRNYHQLQTVSTEETVLQKLNNGFIYKHQYSRIRVFIQTDAIYQLLPQHLWYYHNYYPEEAARGYAALEDLFVPADMILELPANDNVIVAYSLTKLTDSLNEVWEHSAQYHATLKEKSQDPNHLIMQLKLGTTHFITQRKTPNSSIIAGYPWFKEWGRDAMISLPGLTLITQNYDIACGILKRFALRERNGLIPNYLGEHRDDDAFNAVDTSLWFGWAVQQFFLKTHDAKKVLTYFWVTLKNIFNHFKRGTTYGIKMLATGLLTAGDATTNLTWMDACINGTPVTPRDGLPIEVNALWFNLLRFMYELANLCGDPLKHELADWLTAIRQNFLTTFWSEQDGYCYDYVNDKIKNRQLRPNQIIALALPYSLIPRDYGIKMMQQVIQHLLTPYGLRTLAPYDQQYLGNYAGSVEMRDRAYHNGTVWPWLLGFFTEAALKVMPKVQVKELLLPTCTALAEHMNHYGLNNIAEIFSGDYPYQPNGCPMQAWSVAETLRMMSLL